MKKEVEKIYDEMTMDDYLMGAKTPGGTYPYYELKLYGSDGNDYIDIQLDTDEVDGHETRKTANFIEVLLENGISFSLEPREGGVWWKSEWDEYRAFAEYKKKQSEMVGDDE